MNFFDLHCDTPYKCFTESQDFYKNNLAVSTEKGKVFDNWHQVFAIWINDTNKEPFKFYKSVLNDFKQKLKNAPANLTPILAVEGGNVIGDNIDLLYSLKEDDIRFFTLTWNGENLIAGGQKSDADLTPFGKRVIEELNKLKIICDLSHLNDKSFFKAIEVAEFPVATHSNCREICNSMRNLTDIQLKLIKERNGLVGLCFYPDFLGDNVYQQLYKNIYHLLDLGMEKNIAIGSDFDGADMCENLNNISHIPCLYKFLEQKGINTATLDKIFYENAYNFIETFDKAH